MTFMRETIGQMRPYVTPPVETPLVKLNQNESPYNLPQEVLAQVQKRLEQLPFNRYNEGSLASLRQRIAGKFLLDEDQVAFGCGIDELFYYIMLAFVEQGEKVVRPVPSFGMYEICAKISGAKDVAVLLDDRFNLTQEFVAQCKKAKLTFICRPNSQTGNSWNKKIIEEIIKTTKGIVCIDEAYAEFAGDDCLDFLTYKNVLIVRTFSKVYSAALIRLGYVLGSKELIEGINHVRLPWNVSGITEIIGEVILDNETEFMKRRDEIVKSREDLYQALKKITRVYQSDANFLTFEVEYPKEAYQKLLAKGIQVRDVSSYPLLSKCLRVTVGSKKENEQFLDALSSIFNLPKAVIFDIDGVLVDVSNSYREAIKRTVEVYRGNPATDEEIETIKKLPNSNNDWVVTYAIAKGIGENLENIDRTAEEFQVMQETFQKFYLEGLINNEPILIKPSLILDLEKKGIAVGVVTSRPRVEALYTLRRIGRFEERYVIAQEDCDEEKPSPKPIQVLLRRMGVSRALYIGDTVNDKIAATRANVTYEEVNRTQSVNEILKRTAL